MKDFKIGQRVVVLKNVGIRETKNKMGTVVAFLGDHYIGVEFDERIADCHRLNGNIGEKRGLWVTPQNMRLAEADTVKQILKRYEEC